MSMKVARGHNLDRNPAKQVTRYNSPILLLIIVTSAIFLSEIIVMFLIPLPLGISLPAIALIDSLFLIIFLFPILYFFVFHQLRSHISELIKANEQLETRITERNEAEHALQLGRNRLKGILDAMRDGVCIINQSYLIRYINPAVEKEWGPVNGRKCYEYFHDRMEACPWCKISEVSAGKSIRLEQYFPKTEKTFDLFGTTIMNEDGTISKLSILREITDRKRAEMALRESEEKYRMLVETMNEGLVIVDENGTVTYVNDKLCDMLGRFPQDIIGHPVVEFIDERNQNILKDQMAKRKRGESGIYEIAWRCIDGGKISAIVSPKPIFGKNREFKGSFAVITDITQQKQAEEVLKESEEQLRFLSSQLLTAQETERRRISRELHDELGQALAVLKLRTGFIKESLHKDEKKAREECERSLRYIDRVIENVRCLSRDLSPPILQDVGLTAAIKWLVENITLNHQTRVTLDLMQVDDLFSEDAKIMIYRIIQEALTNIVRYAEAKNVSVTIRKNGNGITFCIDDDGKGFNVVQAVGKGAVKRGLGLTTMDERVRILRGILDLRSEGGNGTQISFTIPSTNGESLQ